jgi:hypothetical protein
MTLHMNIQGVPSKLQRQPAGVFTVTLYCTILLEGWLLNFLAYQTPDKVEFLEKHFRAGLPTK